MSKNVVIVGSGNAALCAGLAALEAGAAVTMLEKGDEALAGGNTKYTAGAMRFAYGGADDLLPLLTDRHDPRLARTEFGAYPEETFAADLQGFNEGAPLTPEQEALVARSGETMRWLASHGVTFEPIWARQSFERDGRHVFWGGLTLAAAGEGVGLWEMERAAYLRLGGTLRYGAGATGLIDEGGRIAGVRVGEEEVRADAVVLASGGFEASEEMRAELMGGDWPAAQVRGTPLNTGDGLRMALAAGAARHGAYGHAHATPMDRHMKPFGGLDLDPGERKNYRKICYFLGVMLNAEGKRFVDEGENFRNYTYAQFGRAVLAQPGHRAWQVFDAKTLDLLYAEYRFHDAHFVEANTLEGLIAQMDVAPDAARETLAAYNAAVDESVPFDPAALDGRGAPGLVPPRSNWAQRIDTPPFRAFPVTGGITFTYGGVRVDEGGAVLRDDGRPIEGLHACGEMVGRVFLGGYPGGSGLTSGAVFGRRAGRGAADCA